MTRPMSQSKFCFYILYEKYVRELRLYYFSITRKHNLPHSCVCVGQVVLPLNILMVKRNTWALRTYVQGFLSCLEYVVFVPQIC